jgi:predicted dehydrogenase
MDVVVVGVGRMGKHHARTYRQMPQANLVAVVDFDEERAATVADEYGCAFFTSIDALLQAHPGVKAASVAVPTKYHAAAAQPLLARKIACLVEKPLASTVVEARALAEFAEAHKTALQVGHTERFNPAVRALMKMNIHPRFMEVHRISPMTFRSLDVGVVMDMMIHDLDIVLMLANSPLKRVEAIGVTVMGQHEDVANARLVFESGCVANITASRLALKTERKLRLFSEDAYVSLNYQDRNGVVIRKSANEGALHRIRQGLAEGQDLSSMDYSDLVEVDDLSMDPAEGSSDPLTAELTSFLDAVRHGRRPEVDAVAGYAAVDAAERVVASIAAHQWEGLGSGRV